jgi:UDP-3-O-[3-hydroxymyristoyl] glucosamine N-acyltransferase
MKLPVPHTLKEIAALIACPYEGDAAHSITGLNEIHMVEPGDLVFVDHPKYYDKALQSNATTILINTPETRQGKVIVCPQGKALILSDDPFRDYNKLVRHFQPETYSLKPISDSAVIGKNTIIMPGVYLGNNVTIGDNCIIHPNVVIYDNTTIKNNVIIHANTVIGGHAFYYKKRADKFDKMLSCGGVIIEDDVEIGVLCSIDKGVSGNTVIGAGTKLDNHVQIGHDTQVGKMCLMASHVGVSGAVVIKDGVTLWGQAGVRSDVTLGKGSVLLAQAGLTDDLPEGKTYFGSPAGEARTKMREVAALKKLPDLINKIK